MINCTIPIVEIDMQDCVGDTVGKINYNSLALDTTVCNLSSLFYTNNINLNKIYNDLNYLTQQYSNLNLLDKFTTDYKNLFLEAATTVNLLSSFWGNFEFSIQIPINAISLPISDLTILAPTLSSTNNIKDVYNLANGRLKILSESYLNVNHPITNYPNNTVINVCFFLYNLVPVVKDQNTNIDPLIKTKYSPTSTFSYSVTGRNITANYTRNNVYLSTGIVLRFYAYNNKWNYIGYYLNDQNSTAEPNHNTLVILPKAITSENLAAESTSIVGSCNTIESNTWYPIQKYIYANSLYSGTSTKLGTITLTLRTPDNKVSIFKHKASGHNPNTNTGGTDVFIEVDNNLINAYEQYPIEKTLVQSWVNPYRDITGVNFKFTADSAGVSFVVCGSTSIV